MSMFGKEKPTMEAAAANLSASDVQGTIDLSGPITLDLAEVRDEPVVIGWHSVRIERAEPKVSRQKQIPQIFVMARISDEADPEFNRTLIWNLSLSGDGLVFTKRCFRALGLPAQLNYPSYQALADELVGLEVEVQVKHRMYDKVMQANVNNWRPVTTDVSF